MRSTFSGIRRWCITTLGFIRRELVDLRGQPQLLATLILGPFAILLLFGGGYRNETISLRAAIVVGDLDSPEGQAIVDNIEENEDAIRDYVVPVSVGDDVVAARDLLVADEVDIVVVFPPESVETIRSGERVEIAVLHDKIDPIQQAAVDIAARVAVQEINAQVVTQVVLAGQAELEENEGSYAEVRRLSDELSAATAGSDPDEVERAAADLDRALSATELGLGVSSGLVTSLDPDEADPEEQQRIEQARTDLSEVSSLVGTIRRDPRSDDAPATALEVNRMLQDILEPLEDVRDLPADVLVRPFTHDVEGITGQYVDPVEFFVPSALALLIQHAGMTFAALTIVRDRDLGLLELYRVGSIRMSSILVGKLVAFLLVGAALAALLVVVVDLGLGVGVVGSLGWLAAVVLLLLTASIAMGLLFSVVASSDTQGVQFALLFLLTSIFFGGFFLDLDALRYPFKALSWALPVTYAIRGAQDVMLRGDEPALVDLAGLTAIAAIAGVLAWTIANRLTRAR